jgi:alkylation response protein AidB-like acyl-CoA dehydrogenase
MPATAEILLQRAAELVPTLRGRAEETERQRQVPAQTIADLTKAGLFRVVQPKRFGGAELDFNVLIRLVAEVSRGCGSTGWVYSLGATSGWIVALFPPEMQEEIWGANPDALAFGAVAPSAVAEKVDGGYRLSGTWNYTSGCDNADWIFVAAFLPDDGPRPAPAFLMAPRAEFRFEDNWHTVGLAGTGSKNVVLDGAFIPAHRTVGFAPLLSGAAPGAALNVGPIYRIPFMAIVPLAIATPALGIAQAALDDFMAMAQGRTTKGAVAGGGSKMVEFASVQTRVAEAAGLIHAARLLLLHDTDDVTATAASGRTVDVAQRIRNRRDHALAVKFCVEAVNGLYAATGANGLFLDNHLQRAWRDINAIAKHISVNWDAVGSMYGQHTFGLEPKGQY